MPRPPRLLLSQSYYHIMTRGNNKNIVFRDDSDYLYYLDLISRFKKLHPFDLYHYCLMPNHVHLLVKTNNSADFSNFMKKINLAYFHYYRNKYDWVGHFWQDRYKSQPVGKDNYFIQCGKYIELNPVRGGLVSTPEKYPYSSASYYIEGISNRLITEDIFFVDLGMNYDERRLNYKNLIVEDLIVGSYQRSVWGTNYQRYQENRKRRNYFSNK